MRLHRLLLALGCLGATLSLTSSVSLARVQPRPPAAGQDSLDAAVERLRSVLAAKDSAERAAALDALVALADPEAVDLLLTLQTKNSREWRESRDEAFRLGREVEHLSTILAQMEERVKRDKSLEQVLEAQRKRLEEVQARLENRRADHALADEWRSMLFAACQRFDELVDRSGGRKVSKSLWDAAREDPKVERRLAAIDWLGLVGGAGTAPDIQALMVDVVRSRAKLDKELGGEMKRVRQVELRVQREQEQLGGQLTRALAAEYDSVRRRAGELRQELTTSSYLLEACVDAGARALGREEPKLQKRSIAALSKELASTRDGVRLYTLQLLARSRGEEVQRTLLELLTREKDPAALGELILEVAPGADEAFATLLRDQYLDHKNWHVRACAANALARMRSRAAIPALIERLESAEGRLATDLRGALRSLTGKDFRSNAKLWRQWWSEAEAGFEVPELLPQPEAGSLAQDEVGTTLFGIETGSQRVLFVLDVSGSMDFSLVARNNPTDDPSLPHDMPMKGEISRLAAAKRAMAQALGGLREGAHFGIICYASSVWSPTDGLIDMREKDRAEVLEMVNAMKASGGTNILGALEIALELAGLDGGDAWSQPEVDTIYFLTDGRASVGSSTDPEDILAYVREKNRAGAVVIHTIGLSGAQDAFLLRQLADENGGTYVSR